MLEPSLAFYVALFGAIKMGAIAVPLFTLFGPDGVRLRVEDCAPRLLLTNAEKAETARAISGLDVRVADETLMAELAPHPPHYEVQSAADDLAVFQYTSGTTRELPAAVRHTHRAIVVLMVAALYGTGIRPGDRYFCPSSPAWGHGLWHGTLAPLALGVTTGTMAGKFDAVRLLRALQDYEITNLSAAATHYRMMKSSGEVARYRYAIRKLSFTGEPIDSATRAFVEAALHVPVCSMYGTTEVGVILGDYPGAEDYVVKPGALGKPVPGVRVEVQGPDGQPCHPLSAEALHPGTHTHRAHSQELCNLATRLSLAEVPEGCCLEPDVGFLRASHQPAQLLPGFIAELQHGCPPEAMLPQTQPVHNIFSLTP